MKPVLAIRQVEHEGLERIADALQSQGLAHQHADMFAEPPREFRPDDWAGLVVMGGPMNVDETDRYPFLATQCDWISRSLRAGLPVLGICLGAQLIAKALGARVYKAPQKEVGWYEVELTEAAAEDRLFQGSETTQTVFHWHGDTFDLPDRAVRLATSEMCPNQAFRLDTAYALQFHLEVTVETIQRWLEVPVMQAELGEATHIDKDSLTGLAEEKLPAMTALGDQVFGRFAEMCRYAGQ